MTFFTPQQLRVLKSAWIFTLIAWALLLLQHDVAAYSTGYPSLAIRIFTFAGLFGWEYIISSRWKDLLIIVLITVLGFGASHFLESWLPPAGTSAWASLSHLNVFTAFLLVILTRYHLAGIDNRVTAGILATILYYFLPKTGNPFNSNFQFTGLQVSYFTFMLSALLLFYMKMICYYVIIFLVENGYRLRHFLEKLPSKVQVFNRWEYLFIWMTIYFAYMGCIGDLSTRVSSLFEGTPMPAEPPSLSLLFMLASIFFLYAGAIMLRNVITGRALTISRYSPWLLLLHFVPVVNVVTVVICFFSPEKQKNHMKNAVVYLHTRRAQARKVMIAAGILITAWNIYNMLVVPTGLRLLAIGILAVLYLLKIGAYLKLPSNKTFVYLVIGLNIITVAYSINEYFIIYLAFIYLYYYFLVELFYPELEAEDIMEVADGD